MNSVNVDPLSIVAMLRGIAIHLGDGSAWVCTQTDDHDNHEILYTAYSPAGMMLYTVMVKSNLPYAPEPIHQPVYFRNLEEIEGIEADSLWKQIENEKVSVFLLVDEDLFFCVPYQNNESKFRKIEDQKEIELIKKGGINV